MSDHNTNSTGFSEITPRVSEWQYFKRVFFSRGLVIFGIIVFLLLIFTAIFAPLLAPYDPNKIDMKNTLLQPNSDHLLGTDPNGRDTLSRLIYGSRTALMVGFITTGIAAAAGIVLGLLAGYIGGIANIVIMRATDMLMAIPMIILALVVASVLGSGIKNVIIALSVATIPGYVRVLCGLALSIKENDYILAQRTIGSGNIRIMIKHILPNAIAPLIVMATMQLGTLILAEAGLSFLGIGITTPTAAWGSMVNEGYKYLLDNPVLSFAPGLTIMLVVFAFMIVGDGLRDALDPRLRGTL
ncbi:MAG: ABC transporter permease [Dehalococcoidales bacterium]|nr:ABC transporter permease [Dehalococcoidales bacterium]